MRYSILTLLLITSLTLSACQSQASYSYEDYQGDLAQDHHEIYTLITESLLPALTPLLNPDAFYTDYDHSLLKTALSQLVDASRDLEYNLSKTGPRLSDPALMTSHSNMEFILADIHGHLLKMEEAEIYTTRFPNQFTLYSQLHMDLRTLLPLITSYVANLTSNYSYIEEDKKKALMTLYDMTYIDYHLASKVGTYETFSGLHVSPKTPYLISDKNNKTYQVTEYDYQVLFKIKDHLNQTHDLLAQYKDLIPRSASRFLEEKDQLITQYLTYRSGFPNTFFKDGSYQSYTSKQDGIYRFNVKKYPDQAFDLLEASYYRLFYSMEETQHKNYLFYKGGK